MHSGTDFHKFRRTPGAAGGRSENRRRLGTLPPLAKPPPHGQGNLGFGFGTRSPRSGWHEPSTCAPWVIWDAIRNPRMPLFDALRAVSDRLSHVGVFRGSISCPHAPARPGPTCGIEIGKDEIVTVIPLRKNTAACPATCRTGNQRGAVLNVAKGQFRMSLDRNPNRFGKFRKRSSVSHRCGAVQLWVYKMSANA